MLAHFDYTLHGLINASLPHTMRWHLWNWLHWAVHEISHLMAGDKIND